MIPATAAAQLSEEASLSDDVVSLIHWQPSPTQNPALSQTHVVIFVLQSVSSEFIPQLPRKLVNKLKLPKGFEKKMCVAIETFGIKACAEIESHNAASIKDCPLYAIIGKHAVVVDVAPGKWQ